MYSLFSNVNYKAVNIVYLLHGVTMVFSLLANPTSIHGMVNGVIMGEILIPSNRDVKVMVFILKKILTKMISQ